MKQVLSFGIVGTIGFIVDASFLLLFVEFFLFDIYLARFLSFLCAVFVTWVLNRNLTFKQSKEFSKRKEYLFYLAIQSFGAILNYIIFIFLVKNFEFFESYLIIPLAIASLVAMFLNFFMLKRKVFI